MDSDHGFYVAEKTQTGVTAVDALRAMRDDDTESEIIGDVYTKLAGELWATFYMQCLDTELASDTLNEAFARLHAYNGRPIRNRRAWLIRVGTNWLIDFMRRKRHIDSPLEAHEHPPSDIGDPYRETLAREFQQRVRGALLTLRIEDRLVLVLRYGVGWSSARIADSFETTVPAVDMRLSRARAKLRSLLKTTDPA